jgi:L-rhamnose mutarotase
MKRFGMVIRLKPETYEEYKQLHANVWPDVLKMIHACNIRNYSIYHKDGHLFSYFEYVGEDFDADITELPAMSRRGRTSKRPLRRPSPKAAKD